MQKQKHRKFDRNRHQIFSHNSHTHNAHLYKNIMTT